MTNPVPAIARRRVAQAAGALLAAAVCAGASPAFSQTESYPNRTIRIVVPFAAGGGVDALARMVADRVQPKLGVNVVVENRAGANGAIGGASVMQSPPDGYTLLLSSNTHPMAQLVMARAPYDALTDFTFVARIAQAPLLVVMSNAMPARTLAEVVAAARKDPGKWTAGTAALGSPGHVAIVKFMQLAKLNLTVAQYRGTAPALTDVVGGHIQMLMDSIIMLLPQARDGKVKALAVTDSKRSSIAPDVPTAAESGMPGLEQFTWYGVWGPKGMPTDVSKRLHEALNSAINELAASGRLKEIGVEAVNESPQDFVRITEAEVARNTALFKAMNLQPQ